MPPVQWQPVRGTTGIGRRGRSLETSASAGYMGDYNNDQVVDAGDYAVWRNNLGGDTLLPNDTTTGVGPDDYTRWKMHYGEWSGNAGGAGVSLADAVAAEPATLGLCSLAVLAWGVLVRWR
jgi:hypothetical protein